MKRIEKIGKTLVLNPWPLNKGFFSSTSDDYPSIIVYDQADIDVGDSNIQDFAKFITVD